MPLTRTLHREAENLAARSRMGNQNATGMIEEIGKNARAGHPQAVASFPVILKYLADHPMPGTTGVSDRGADILMRLAQCFTPPFVGVAQVFLEAVDVGEEGILEGATALLADGPELTPEVVAHVMAQFPAPYGEGLEHGLAFAGDPDEMGKMAPESPQERAACAIGACLGTARRWQAVRRGAPATFLSPHVAWEVE